MLVKKRTGIILGAVSLVALVVIVAIAARGRGQHEPRPKWAEAIASPESLDDKSLDRELRRLRRAMLSGRPKGNYIVVDTHANQLSLRTADSLLFRADCSTCACHELVDTLTDRRWVFRTPRGVFKFNS